MNYAPILLAALIAMPAFAREKPADTVFLHGYVYTVDAHDSVAQAVAVKDGVIVYVGDDAGAKAFTGRKTHVVDLAGRMLMPGLIDGHMHPQSGGLRMLDCNLNYESLTISEFRAGIQKCVDADTTAGPDDWLKVINWFEPGMKPDGIVLTHEALDGVKTTRPIMVHSTYGHSDLTNARGLQLAGITKDTPDPKDGVIVRDAAGNPTGLLEDAAKDAVENLVPSPSPAKNLEATTKALDAMARQGITTFLDAYTDIDTLTAYTTVSKAGKLTARGHFAVLIDSVPDYNADTAIAEVLREKAEFEQKPDGAKPTLRIHTAKLFLDGVINAPSFTGLMVQPYFENRGTTDAPDWRPGSSTGPVPYFSPQQLGDTLSKLAAAGIDPHMHADGDGAVREALDAIAVMRKAHPDADVRPAVAHDEIVDPDDYDRYAALNALPVLSFQWEKPAVDVEALKGPFGPERYALIEPSGLLDLHGARIVYGSDWPVDPLNEWEALRTAVTRTATGDDAAEYPGRLGVDPGLPLKTALRAITLNAAYSLHQDTTTGSIEAGKWADLIVLDRNLFQIDPQAIADTRVLLTMVGGKVVYEVEPGK